MKKKKILAPIIKWAGGKRKLAPTITKFFGKFRRYFEPFVGGAAVMLHLLPEDAVCSDTNPELINLYDVIKNHPEELCSLLEANYIPFLGEAFYYQVRNRDRQEGYLADDSEAGRIDRAARFLFLNKTAFNGLCRVNSKGQNNVSYGKYKNPCILDKEAIMNLSRVLNEKNISFCCCDYKDTMKEAKAGDLVYMDPPYDVEEGQNSFVQYAKSGFNRDNQIELKAESDKLIVRGCKVFISNSDTTFIRELYGNDPRYVIHDMSARRSIACKAESRKTVNELLIEGRPQQHKHKVIPFMEGRKFNNVTFTAGQANRVLL